MRKLLLLCAVFLLFVFPVVANATPISAALTGTRSTADISLIAAGGWSGTENNGFEISWDIIPTIVGTTTSYSYEYTISGEGGSTFLSKGLSHWILEVTDPSIATDFTMTIAEAVNSDSEHLSESSAIPFEGPDTFEDNSSNPDMPCDIHGIKWNMEGDDGIFADDEEIVKTVITFTSLKNPVWGDFYAKNGRGSDETWTTAWNLGFGTDPDAETTTDFTNWIATPDGGSGGPGGGIPEPATMLLLGSGLIGLAVSGKKRFKKRNR